VQRERERPRVKRERERDLEWRKREGQGTGVDPGPPPIYSSRPSSSPTNYSTFKTVTVQNMAYVRQSWSAIWHM